MQYIFYPLYYIFWTLALPILSLLSLTLVRKWRQGLKYRLGYLDPEKFIKPSKYTKLINTDPMAKPIWFHAVSVGELNALIPLLKVFIGRPLLLSVTTDTAYKMAENKLKEELENNFIRLIYMPWDHPHIINSVLERINPRAIILMESEIWPGLIFEASKRKIKVMIVNAKLSDNSYKTYQTFRLFISWMFEKLSLILVQTPQDSRKYINMKVDKSKIFMTGNMKFSALPNVKLERSAKLRSLLGYKNNDIVWVCGSTHPEEEILLTAIFQELKDEIPQLRLVLAPRHPERFGVVETIINSAAHLNPIRLSHIKQSLQNYAQYHNNRTVSGNLVKLAENQSTTDTEKISLDQVLYDVSHTEAETPDRTYSADDVLLVDTIGDLMDIYSIADIAFVGGTMNDKIGGHNILEPAACRVPVVIGPHYYKNTEMVNMMHEADALIIAESKEDLRLAILDLALNPDKRILMGSEAKNLTEKNRRIVVDVADLLKKEIY